MKIKYFVLGIRPSAEKLRNYLVFNEKNVELISFDGTKNRIPKYLINERLSETLSRKFSNTDYACAYVHYLAYLKSSESDWYVYFEDDVNIESVEELEQFLKETNISTAKLITFNEFESKKFIKYKWWYRPYRTHAYAVNSKAIELINKYYDQIITGPDWPFQWEYLFDFYNLPVTGVKLDNNIESLLENSRNEYQLEMLNNYRAFAKNIKRYIPSYIKNSVFVKKIFKWIQIFYRTLIVYKQLKNSFFLRIKISLARSICESHYLN